MKTMRTKVIKISSMIILVLMVSSVSFAKQSITPLVLIDEGQPRAAILLSEKPTKSAQLGAFELQEHIRLITGVELPIRREGRAKTQNAGEIVLSIGDTVLARKNGLQGSDFALRERLVKVIPNAVFLIGRDAVDLGEVVYRRAQLAHQPADSRVNGNASDYVWVFVNAVARELKQSHPDKWVSSLAYWHYSFPPQNIRLEDNIAVQLCMQTRMPYALERQKTDWEMASAWGRAYPDMPKYVWAYYCFPEERSNRGPRGQRDWQPSWHVFPGFFARTIASEFRKYRDINVRGIFFNGMGYDVENFVTFAMLEDVDCDVEALLSEYFEDM